MKRITVWVDFDDAEVGSVKKKLEAYLRAERVAFTFLPEGQVSYSP